MNEYSLIARTHKYYTFVGIYETTEPAPQDNNNNNFCRFHGKLYIAIITTRTHH